MMEKLLFQNHFRQELSSGIILTYVILVKPRTENTIRQYLTWKNLSKTVEQVCKTCPTCQRTKRDTKQYGLLPPKDAEAVPW